jgi:hypothetical protein
VIKSINKFGKWMMKYITVILCALVVSPSSANSLEKAKLFANDVGVIFSYYNSSIATIEICGRRYNSDVTRNFFISHNKKIFDDANKLLVKKFGYELANRMFDRARSDMSIQIKTSNRQYECAIFLRQHMNRERDIKILFTGQMKRIFGAKRFLY